jgi:hypothetical protein
MKVRTIGWTGGSEHPRSDQDQADQKKLRHLTVAILDQIVAQPDAVDPGRDWALVGCAPVMTSRVPPLGHQYTIQPCVVCGTPCYVTLATKRAAEVKGYLVRAVCYPKHVREPANPQPLKAQVPGREPSS